MDYRLTDSERICLATHMSPLGRIPPLYQLGLSRELVGQNDKPIRGLFTTKAITANTLIGEYRGPILSEAESQGRRKSNYMFSVIDGTTGGCKHVIDGASKSRSSFLRYVNSPNSESGANARFTQVDDHILLTTIRHIPANTEILAWYGPETKDIVALPVKS